LQALCFLLVVASSTQPLLLAPSPGWSSILFCSLPRNLDSLMVALFTRLEDCDICTGTSPQRDSKLSRKWMSAVELSFGFQ
jgi:hypothetical protein